ncbi:hypothetical protein B0T24DRAFT_600317 [Lasiosphaeria ovina]|uniref:Uncharacterized protein n=1 Tax=Lasiosphaeria ovina TaxID=92902 RepID=A0AAE0MYK9_9PEZI|nr:hypothetical protein B0T24DRAFT_600317 [Lasiosphaeria ovina]
MKKAPTPTEPRRPKKDKATIKEPAETPKKTKVVFKLIVDISDIFSLVAFFLKGNTGYRADIEPNQIPALFNQNPYIPITIHKGDVTKGIASGETEEDLTRINVYATIVATVLLYLKTVTIEPGFSGDKRFTLEKGKGKTVEEEEELTTTEAVKRMHRRTSTFREGYENFPGLTFYSFYGTTANLPQDDPRKLATIKKSTKEFDVEEYSGDWRPDKTTRPENEEGEITEDDEDYFEELEKYKLGDNEATTVA